MARRLSGFWRDEPAPNREPLSEPEVGAVVLCPPPIEVYTPLK
jgi:hypothetical protein